MKKQKRGFILLFAFLFILLILSNAFASSFADHQVFRQRGKGACYALNGRITMRIVYVDTADGLWTEEAKAGWRRTTEEAMEMLDDAARLYGMEVDADYIEFHVSVADENTEDYDAFVLGCLLQNEELKEHVRLLENEDNVFTVFTFLNERRSLAYANWDGMLSESIVANSHDSETELMHEILHLFGAVDLYFPADFEQAAMTYCPDSIMLSTNGKRNVDSITAYAIGWTDTVDDTALLFLADTEHVTPDTLDQAHKEELYTGYAFKRSDNNTCYGYLENGILNGYGVCRWENGDWYAGTFENGIMHGQGSYHWDGGTVYTGSYINGKRTGLGCIVWVGGTMYVGSFENGEITGEGMYAWPDGSFYTGGVLDGAYHGYGTYTDSSGQVLAGYWENGNFQENRTDKK